MAWNGENRIFVPNPAISWTDNGGPLLLFDHERASYHALSGHASDIWRMLDGAANEAQIAAALAARYDAPADVLSGDIADFLDKAAASGLIARRA